MDWFMRKSVGKPWFLPAIIVVSCKPSFIYFWDMDGVSFRCRVLLGNPHGEHLGDMFQETRSTSPATGWVGNTK
jgi:hypothetical protein